MNSLMVSDEASRESEFLSALNASLESFVHKTLNKPLKDEQLECIRRIVCGGRDVLAVLPSGFGKSALCLPAFGTDEQWLCDRWRNALQLIILAHFIRQRSWLSMKCILWQHGRF